MKFRIHFLIIAFVLVCMADLNAQNDLNQLSWMVGRWNQETQTNGYNITETWKMVSPDRMQGESIKTDRNGRVISTETMMLAKKGDEFFLEAKFPGNNEVIAFRIVKMSDEGFTCRNSRNVFPSQIIYAKKENGMTADLSGRGRLTQLVFSKIEIVIED